MHEPQFELKLAWLRQVRLLQILLRLTFLVS